ncbi:hypothetical protein M438DRAFT_112339 [Aureobasidium pullulans EXF-150]|uniref:Uncharacterized protein n=1 Tax=Aureobasidium pullulans EXF-150 TaxID=1043002 RepID=A0A074XDT9_AURPU|nr:uncharacterized protein M438DRAFT_112339 [Aureobasidium pullulans EXF-150]KEQ80192.1 hypothetical protein M438DRAFT_112339 [Aureobasidium pullulans EXF-150]
MNELIKRLGSIEVLQWSEGSVLIIFVQAPDPAGSEPSKGNNADWTVEHLGDEALEQCTTAKWTCRDLDPLGRLGPELERYGIRLIQASGSAIHLSLKHIVFVGDGLGSLVVLQALSSIVSHPQPMGNVATCFFGAMLVGIPPKGDKGPLTREWLELEPTLDSLYEKTANFHAPLSVFEDFGELFIKELQNLIKNLDGKGDFLHNALRSGLSPSEYVLSNRQALTDHDIMEALHLAQWHATKEAGRISSSHLDGSIDWKIWDTLAERIDICSSIESEFWCNANIRRDFDIPQSVDFGGTKIALLSWELPEAVRDWDLSRQLSDYLDSISISGRDGRFEALDCNTYLRKYWGNLGVRIASLLLTAAAQVYWDKGETITLPVDDKDGLVVFAFPTHVLLLTEYKDTYLDSRFCEIAQWFCQTFRIPKTEEKEIDQGLQISRSIALDHRLLGEERSGDLCFLLQPLMPFNPSRADCWTSLFKLGIVAEISDDKFVPLDDFEGIEIDFQLMVSLAAVTSYYWLETDHTAGFILLGFFTALVPVSMHTSGAIEWHFESNYPKVLESIQLDHQTAPPEFLCPLDLESTQGLWVPIKDTTRLHTKRCFVGLWPQAEVFLGSEGAEYALGESNLPCLSKALHFEGAELAGALGGAAGPVQPIFQGTAVYKLRSHVQQFEKATCYAAALNILTRQVALVYDRQSDIGWLVPQLSLLLHLCHVYYAMHHGTSGQPDPIPWALPSSDGASAALEAFSGSNEVVVTSHGPHKKVLLENVLLTLNANFMQTHRTKRSPTPTIVGSKKLYFSELMDQVTQPPGGSPLRVLKTSKLPATKAWLDIINHVDALFVCKNIGQAIGFAGILCPSNNTSNPNGPSGPPTSVADCQCSEIPHGQGYLVAHNKCLRRVLSRSPLACNLAGQPFDPQNKHSLWTCPVQVLQNLEKLDSHKERVANPPPGGPPEGAIVFGRLKGSWF